MKNKQGNDLEDFELDEYKLEDMYNEHLDEVFPECTIAGFSYSTSNALQEVDSTAYRCGFNDWLDDVLKEGALFELDGKYYTEDPANFEDESENE